LANHYIIELFDHRDKTQNIEYSYGFDEIDAVYQALDPPIPRFPGMKIKDLREILREEDVQFIGVMIDTFVYTPQKISVEVKKEYQKGGRNEVSKSPQRSNQKKPRSRKASRRGHHK